MGQSSKNLFHEKKNNISGMTHGDDFVVTGPTARLIELKNKLAGCTNHNKGHQSSRFYTVAHLSSHLSGPMTREIRAQSHRTAIDVSSALSFFFPFHVVCVSLLFLFFVFVPSFSFIFFLVLMFSLLFSSPSPPFPLFHFVHSPFLLSPLSQPV